MHYSDKNHLNIPWNNLTELIIDSHFIPDIISNDIYETYPDLPVNYNWKDHIKYVMKRKLYLINIDIEAEKGSKFSFKKKYINL